MIMERKASLMLWNALIFEWNGTITKIAIKLLFCGKINYADLGA